MNRDHEPNSATRDRVKRLAAIGTSQNSIAALLHIHPETLRQHYAHEIDFGLDAMLEQVGNRAYELALDGDRAMIALVLKSKGAKHGWQEKTIIEAVSSAETLELRQQVLALEASSIKDY